MKNNIINIRHAAWNDIRNNRDDRTENRTARLWLEVIAESIYRLTICACSIFCMYLAYTML